MTIYSQRKVNFMSYIQLLASFFKGIFMNNHLICFFKTQNYFLFDDSKVIHLLHEKRK